MQGACTLIDYCNEALYPSPQFHIESKIGFRLCPKSVNEYSTLGGTSAYTLRLISPFSSISRSCAVNTFCDTLPMDFFYSPKRFVPESKSLRIKTFHLSPISINVVSTGQAGSSLTEFCSFITASPNRSYTILSLILYHTKLFSQGFRRERRRKNF